MISLGRLVNPNIQNKRHLRNRPSGISCLGTLFFVFTIAFVLLLPTKLTLAKSTIIEESKDIQISAELMKISGDHQWGEPDKPLEEPFKVRVVYSSAPEVGVEKAEVTFKIVSQPEGANASLSEDKVITDNEGYGETRLTLGSEPGIYVVYAECKGAQTSPIAFKAKINEIDVWDSDRRHAKEDLLEIVPPLSGENISGKTRFDSGDSPKWTYEGEIKYGNEVSFHVDGFKSDSTLLKNVLPKFTTISCEDTYSVRIEVYPGNVGKIDLNIEEIITPIEGKINEIFSYIRDIKVELPQPNVDFKNQWREIKGSNKAGWTFLCKLKFDPLIGASGDVGLRPNFIKKLVDKIKNNKLIKKYIKEVDADFYVLLGARVSPEIFIERKADGEYELSKLRKYKFRVGVGGKVEIESKEEYIVVIFDPEIYIDGFTEVGGYVKPEKEIGMLLKIGHEDIPFTCKAKIKFRNIVILDKEISMIVLEGASTGKMQIPFYKFKEG
jgi:hypothetical protein